jgi:hypothetical protein
MMIIQMLMTLLPGVFHLSGPSLLVHHPPDSENAVFVLIVAIDTVRIFYQMSVVDVSPPVTVPDAGDGPGG